MIYPELVKLNAEMTGKAQVGGTTSRQPLARPAMPPAAGSPSLPPGRALTRRRPAPPRMQIVKFNCNAYNKDLGKTLGIKVAPTFHLYKAGEKVAEMTGAKVDKLRTLIEANV